MFKHPAFSMKQECTRTITGIIESIIFANNAIAVLRFSLGYACVKVILSDCAVTDMPQIGEVWAFSGVDQAHLKYGEQFIVCSGFREQPSGMLIIKYIQHHLPGVGITKARRLWSVFGHKLYRVLDDSDIFSLTDKKLGNLSFDIANLFVEKWQANKIETQTIRFFQEIGFSKLLALNSLKFYGEDAIQKIKDNPYRLLAFDGFQLIDMQATKCLRINVNDPRRMNAAVAAAVYKAYDAGHTAILKNDLIQSVKSLAQVTKQEAQQAINQALVDQIIVSSGDDLYQGKGQAAMEKFIARKVVNLLGNTATEQQTLSTPRFKPDTLIEFEKINNFSLNKEQRQAVETALKYRFTIIQGGKGVGKTTCLLALHHQINSNNGKIVQIALSGCAAKRMAKATLTQANTIASFFLKVLKKPLAEYIKLVVYEASMIDVPTMVKLLRVLPDTGSIVLIGDSRKLLPIGSGLILHVLSFIPNIPTVTLTQVHHSDASSGIPIAAELIRQEQKPSVTFFDKTLSVDEQLGLRCISAAPQDISRIAVNFRHFIRNWGEVQIVAPTISICDDINIQIHNSYRIDMNRQIKPLVRCTKSIGLDDIIVCITNLRHKGLINGSLGRVTRVFESAVAVTLASGEIELCYAIAEFDGQEVSLSAADFDKIKLGYCITCNKVQGAEFERVIIAMPSSSILNNSWVYTAVTCAKKQVIVIGDIETLYTHCTTPTKVFNRCVALPRMVQEALNGSAT